MSATLALALAALTVGSATPVTAPSPAELIARWARATGVERPRINVWLNREDDPYDRGDGARVYFKSDEDAYVTVFRIDTDGRVRVLFPIDPWQDNWAGGGRTFEVLGRDRDEAFRVDDYPGVGYIFAIASSDPFDYNPIVRGDHWDYGEISDGRVRGDPYVAVSDLAEQIAREGDYDYDVAEYDVERHYDYPRFVCYDCHSYASWHYWDPYSSYCSRFRIVIYDDWYYYPYRRYGGRYVGRPYRPGPRYVFKDSDPRNDYITRVANRPRTDYSQPRRPEGDRTSADVGGRGTIPAPVSPRRRAPDGGDRGTVAPDRRPDNDQQRRRTPGAGDRGTTPDQRQNDDQSRRRRTGSDSRPDARPETNRDRQPPEGRDQPRRTEPSRDPDRGRDAPQDREDRRRRPSSLEERPDPANLRAGGGREARPQDRSDWTPRRYDRGSDRIRQAPQDRPDWSQRRPDRGSDRAGQARPQDRPDRSQRRPDGGSDRAGQARPQDRSRAEPRGGRDQPRSTGEPQLRRRRPGD